MEAVRTFERATRRSLHSRRSLTGLVLFLAVVIPMVCGARPASAADFAVLNNGFSIRHERREVIGLVTRLYLNANPNEYVDVPTSLIDRFEPDSSVPSGPRSLTLPDLVNTASDRYHLDPDLVNSVIHAESGFNPHAVSSKGAQGLMQLMPQTASHLGVADAFDPGANVEGGTRYLRELLQRYNFDLIKALAAYNAGPQRVDQNHGVPPYYETQAYVARVVRDFNRKKLAEQKAAVPKHATIRRAALQGASTQPAATPENPPSSTH
jgi:soluble lytic murein transglycosylase-like protein